MDLLALAKTIADRVEIADRDQQQTRETMT
jgi:hypothetical protein